MENQQLEYIHQHFLLNVLPTSYEIKITMRMVLPILYTCDIPATYTILKKLLPSIFHSKCFNDNKYSFTKEVRNTEVGHLFEHIMLEYLCIEKMNNGHKSAIYNGETHWNWREDPRGTFHIVIDAGWQDKEVILAALEKTIHLITMILDTANLQNWVYN